MHAWSRGKNLLSYYQDVTFTNDHPLRFSLFCIAQNHKLQICLRGLYSLMCVMYRNNEWKSLVLRFISLRAQIPLLSLPKGLAAPRPLTERRRKRVGRNTSETGECTQAVCECHKWLVITRKKLTFKRLSTVVFTVMAVKEIWEAMGREWGKTKA